MQFISVDLLIYLNVSINREFRRNEKQIITNQVSLEANEKLLKNKKVFYSLHSYCTVHNFPVLFPDKHHYCDFDIRYERQNPY